MNVLVLAWTFTVLLLASTDAEASRRLRDVSGDPSQRYDSRMMSSPMMRFPGLFGISHWPYIVYAPAPSMTIVNVQIQMPELDERPAPTPPPHLKFWIARCGGFVESEVNLTISVMDEERKPCCP